MNKDYENARNSNVYKKAEQNIRNAIIQESENIEKVLNQMMDQYVKIHVFLECLHDNTSRREIEIKYFGLAPAGVKFDNPQISETIEKGFIKRGVDFRISKPLVEAIEKELNSKLARIKELGNEKQEVQNEIEKKITDDYEFTSNDLKNNIISQKDAEDLMIARMFATSAENTLEQKNEEILITEETKEKVQNPKPQKVIKKQTSNEVKKAIKKEREKKKEVSIEEPVKKTRGRKSNAVLLTEFKETYSDIKNVIEDYRKTYSYIFNDESNIMQTQLKELQGSDIFKYKNIVSRMKEIFKNFDEAGKLIIEEMDKDKPVISNIKDYIEFAKEYIVEMKEKSHELDQLTNTKIDDDKHHKMVFLLDKNNDPYLRVDELDSNERDSIKKTLEKIDRLSKDQDYYFDKVSKYHTDDYSVYFDRSTKATNLAVSFIRKNDSVVILDIIDLADKNYPDSIKKILAREDEKIEQYFQKISSNDEKFMQEQEEIKKDIDSKLKGERR